MNTITRISATTLLAVASLTYSPNSWSLGLGEATVESFLNEPLQVRIDLITRETDDLATVTASLASADDYELIGASLEAVPVPVRFAIEDVEGDAHIVATSNLPVGEPVVRLIVEVNWSSGRLLREYTIFLDPPAVPDQAPVPRIDLRESPAAPAPPPATEPGASEPEPAVAETPAPAERPAPAGDSEYGPVRSGETLWGIASGWSRGTGMDINKVMIAIQRENPDAFMNDNINLLKRGAILRMPEAGAVEAISTASAISEVAAQTDEFRGRRTDGPAASSETPLLAETSAAPEAPTPQTPEPDLLPVADEPTAEEAVVPSEPETALEAEPEPETPAADQAAEPAAPAALDQLELVPPSAESELDSAYGFEETDEAQADASVAVSELRENLARTEEELINQQQQNNYLEERISELESQLASAEQGVVADADLANMEDRLRTEREAEGAEVTPAQSGKPAAEQPWYARMGFWLIGLLVALAAFVGWLISRRGGREEAAGSAPSEEERIREIKDEAEEVLRVLDEPVEPEAAGEGEAEKESEAEDEPEATDPEAEGEDAEVLDEESSDPEIQLDLARAYISMGDKEAARVILEEVLVNGSDEQQEEARKMLDVMAPK